jgi:hypothetical protein
LGEENFFDFIEEVLNSGNFNWLVTLGFIPARLPPVSRLTRYWEGIWEICDPDQRYWRRKPGDVWDCWGVWLDEIEVGPPAGPGVRDYIWLYERRLHGESRIHVLISDWQGFEDMWELRWKEISGGWAFTRDLDERIRGLLGYLVMRVGCPLELHCGGFRGRRTASDFRPWKEKNSY